MCKMLSGRVVMCRVRVGFYENMSFFSGCL